MTHKIRIAGAVASKTGVTLYLENGTEMNLPAGSWRTEAIIAQVTEPLARKEIVTLDLSKFSVEQRIEEKTGGFLRFVRKKVTELGARFGLISDDGHTYVGNAPAAPSAAVDDKAETLVAIVKGKEIPGVEALSKHMERAAIDGNTKGLQNFLARLSKIIDKRGHTVDELLRFIQHGDLPLADDGSIIAYKRLKSSGGVFVDCHSGRIRQRVGSRVSMPEAKVDPSRRTLCSTGLHIGRRDYMRNFSGDILVMVKIRPEDVIAVPVHETSKMRVAAYHIVAEITGTAKDLILQNRPMTSVPEAAKLLGDVIAGKHVGVIEEVQVGIDGTRDVKVVPARAPEKPKPVPVAAPAKALDQDAETGIDVKAINRKVEKVVAEKKAAPVKPAKAKPAASKDVRTGVDGKTYDLKKVPEKWRVAFKDVADGKISQREAEKLYRISAKKLRALLREQNII